MYLVVSGYSPNEISTIVDDDIVTGYYLTATRLMKFLLL